MKVEERAEYVVDDFGDPIEPLPGPEDYAYLDEWSSGYEDAPRWYWSVVEFGGGGWMGDVHLWALFFSLGLVVAVIAALLVVKAFG